jgi:hypothetical protein
VNEFTGTIKEGEEILHFSFSRMYTTEGEKYFVAVHRNGNLSHFNMRKDNKGVWRASDASPSWVKAIEEEISKIINQNISPA